MCGGGVYLYVHVRTYARRYLTAEGNASFEADARRVFDNHLKFCDAHTGFRLASESRKEALRLRALLPDLCAQLPQPSLEDQVGELGRWCISACLFVRACCCCVGNFARLLFVGVQHHVAGTRSRGRQHVPYLRLHVGFALLVGAAGGSQKAYFKRNDQAAQDGSEPRHEAILPAPSAANNVYEPRAS